MWLCIFDTVLTIDLDMTRFALFSSVHCFFCIAIQNIPCATFIHWQAKKIAFLRNVIICDRKMSHPWKKMLSIVTLFTVDNNVIVNEIAFRERKWIVENRTHAIHCMQLRNIVEKMNDQQWSNVAHLKKTLCCLMWHFSQLTIM